MQETEFDTSTMGNMPTAEPASSDDKAMMAIWDKHNGEEANLKNPPMPDVPAGVDTFQATADWIKLPLKERQMTSAVHREFADLKKQGESLGMKTETAADMKAIQDMLAGKDNAGRPGIDRDTQASLETFKAVVPFAKTHQEASGILNNWAAAIQRDPDTGWRELLKAQGMSHLLRDAAPGPAEGQGEADVVQWAMDRDLTREDMQQMGDIISASNWREIDGESTNSKLERAHKALLRARARENPHGRMNKDIDASLRAAAADIWRS